MAVLAIIAYAAANMLHEGAGHGGACLLVHGHPLVWSAVHFDCDLTGLGPAAGRIVAAGGTVANLLAAGAAWWLVIRRTPRSANLQFLLWVFATINLLQATGYFLFSGVGGIGDWADVMRGSMSPAVWRPGLAIVGGGLYWPSTRFAVGRLEPFLDPTQPERYRNGARICWMVYLSGGALYCVAGLFNPVGMVLVAISAAAASFGGTSGLAWGSQFLRAPAPMTSAAPQPLRLRRRHAWTVGGLLFGAIFVLILGPGIHFR
ncbi:MAG: hypothetical protein ACRENQ_02705 [Gemmatimonadaceae bacterium]